MKVDTSRTGMVRGYIVFSQWRAGCLSKERAKDDSCIDNGIAYTPWHRHDDDPAVVERELNSLLLCVDHFRDVETCMLGYEYRDYLR